MRLIYFLARNFRGLEDIETEFDNKVNVIVGPNAVGKTTVLEAIRFSKALLAPRTQNESQQTLMALGAGVPYNAQMVFPEAIARDTAKQIEVRCHYQFTDEEIQTLESSITRMATDAVLAQVGRSFGNAAANIAFLSSTPGQQMLNQIQGQLTQEIGDLKLKKRTCNLDITVDPSSRLDSPDAISAALFSSLEQELPPSLTRFSYFPADRALPVGEQPVQIGIHDSALLIESHVSQPHLKYLRLKNTIFNAVIMGTAEQKLLEEEFQRVFLGILKGRRLKGVGVNDRGGLSIRVEDTETGRIFDLDGMSSGEKGLLLTCILIGRSIVDGGIILLDEPELHLNPAVCRGLLDFFVENYIVPKNLQAIICSHSPEILAGAFEKNECSLYHLKSEKILTKVRPQDHVEVEQAVRRLGTSDSEALLYKATIFVEGDTDSEVLAAGFPELLRRYRLRDLGGRRNVEKEITILQNAEAAGKDVLPRYFVFDRDESRTNLKSSKSVRVHQWDRRCLENYLIDVDVLADVLQSAEVVRQVTVTNTAEVKKMLRELAMSQLDEFVATQVYASYSFESPGIRANEIAGKSLGEISEVLVARLEEVKRQTSALTTDWKLKFLADCEKAKRELQKRWDTNWEQDADGKKLFRDLQRRVEHLKVSSDKLKKRVILEMGRKKTKNWLALESQLVSLVT
jgi:predicted ATPase